MNKPRVGFIGLGMMGKPMSKRVLQAGYPLTVFDIKPEPVAELVAQGAGKAATPKEVAEKSDVVLTSLPSMAACEEVYFGGNGLFKGARAGMTLIETSTVPPSVVKRYADAARNKGVSVVDAALLAQGQPGKKGTADEIASRGEIMVVVGGELEEFAKVRAILETFGNPVVHMGELGNGEVAKVLANSIAQSTFCVVCEVLSIATKAGVNMRNLLQVLNNCSAGSWVTREYVPQYLETGTGKAMRVEAAVKDSSSALELARELGVPALMLSLRHTYYEWANNSGLRDRPTLELLKMFEGVIGKPIRFE